MPQPKKEALSEQLKPEYEERLWHRADELMEMRASMTSRRDELYAEIQTMRAKALNLHEKDVVAQKETEYWRIHAKIEDIEKLENQLEAALEKLDAGQISQEELDKLIPQPQKQTPQLSKRKRRILEEMQQLGLHPSEIAWGMYGEFGSNPTRLTTGRHQTGIKANFDPMFGASEFFYRTADTHGGKVAHGKKGRNYFTSASGKRIRKR